MQIAYNIHYYNVQFVIPLFLQVAILHTNHEYDIVVLFHKSHARGETWDYFATPGLDGDVLNNSKAGASLKNVFRLGIMQQMANAKSNTNSSTNDDNDDDDNDVSDVILLLTQLQTLISGKIYHQ